MTVTVHHGDSREVLKALPACSVDSVVCDPPYGLGDPPPPELLRHVLTEWMAGRDVEVAGSGFMGAKWDAFVPGPPIWSECLRVLKPGGHLVAFFGTRTYDLGSLAVRLAGFEVRDLIAWLYSAGFPKAPTVLKPALEPVVLARKPLERGLSQTANIAKWGVGGLNINGCRIAAPEGLTGEGKNKCVAFRATSTGAQPRSAPHDKGRWPANVVHDGSEEVVEAFPQTAPSTIGRPRGAAAGDGWGMTRTGAEYADSGSAARFFYSAKASKADRAGSKHPTVKPIDLMAWLCRLVTRPGGLVLDPFAGSGTTGAACLREGFDCILIEREAQYVADIHRRLAHVEGADTPLFANDPAPSLFGDAA